MKNDAELQQRAVDVRDVDSVVDVDVRQTGDAGYSPDSDDGGTKQHHAVQTTTVHWVDDSDVTFQRDDGQDAHGRRVAHRLHEVIRLAQHLQYITFASYTPSFIGVRQELGLLQIAMSFAGAPSEAFVRWPHHRYDPVELPLAGIPFCHMIPC